MKQINRAAVSAVSCSKLTKLGALLLLTMLTPAGRSLAAGEQPADAAPGPAPRLDFSLLDTAGAAHSLRPHPSRSALVIVFLATECPIANSYVPELNRQSAALREAESNVAVYGVISNRATTFAAAGEYAARFKLEFPLLVDASGELAEVLKPTHTPEAFVIDRDGQIAYRGRIDDLYADLGKRRPAPTRRDLAETIAAVLSGEPLAPRATEPVGCLFESGARSKTQPGVTYTRDIAPLLQAHCVTCHREGEVAPFPLVSYSDAAKRSRQLVRVTQSRFMPPWRPEPEFGHFLNERRLTGRELELFEQWTAAGAPEGDPADRPPPARFAEGWQLGEPDLVVKMPEAFEVPADGNDVFRNFVIPLDLEEDKLVAVAEFRPGNRRVVHHALFYLDNSGVARKKDAADAGPGYGSFGGPGFLPSGSIGGWAPGGTPQRLRDGMGRQLRKGSDLVLQIHYHPTGKAETDESMVGIHFVKQGSRRIVVPITIVDRRLYIPAGAGSHPMSGAYKLPVDVMLIGVIPHMHLLGREMKVTAVLADGTREPLIWIKDWNFNWQDQYHLARPAHYPKGTRIEVEAVYDNSEANPLNPNSPPKEVTWGEQTTDEMFVCFFLMTAEKSDDIVPLMVDNYRSMGTRMRIQRPAPRDAGLPAEGAESSK